MNQTFHFLSYIAPSALFTSLLKDIFYAVELVCAALNDIMYTSLKMLFRFQKICIKCITQNNKY